MLTVLKLGGELLENPAAIASAAERIGRLAERGPLVVVHGGGRAIDAELRARGQEPRFIDGLRITDAAALDAVVAVLAGRNNTALVAAITAHGGRAVGLTGADCGIGLSRLAGAFTSAAGDEVNLGLVGDPVSSDVTLLRDLLRPGYVPVVASIGVAPDGTLLNVNADSFAGHLAAALAAGRLIVAGGTAGVLDEAGRTIERLSPAGMARMIATGSAHSGMIAKLAACERALAGGVPEIAIVNGRATGDYSAAPGTRIERTALETT